MVTSSTALAKSSAAPVNDAPTSPAAADIWPAMSSTVVRTVSAVAATAVVAVATARKDVRSGW